MLLQQLMEPASRLCNSATLTRNPAADALLIAGLYPPRRVELSSALPCLPTLRTLPALLSLASCTHREAFDSRNGGDRGSNTATGSDGPRAHEGYGQQTATGQAHQTLRDALETAGYAAARLELASMCRWLRGRSWEPRVFD